MDVHQRQSVVGRGKYRQVALPQDVERRAVQLASYQAGAAQCFAFQPFVGREEEHPSRRNRAPSAAAQINRAFEGEKKSRATEVSPQPKLFSFQNMFHREDGHLTFSFACASPCSLSARMI